MSIAIDIILTLGLSNCVFAAPTDTTLKVNPVAGHAYTAYQLFVGDLSVDGQTKTLSNVKWGSDVKTTAITYNTNKTVTPVVGEAVPQDVLDYFASLSGKTATDNAQSTADIISDFISDSASGTALSATDTTVTTGYYVIKDTIANASDAGNSTISTNVVEVVGPTNVQPKASTVTSEKHVDDQNDSDSTDLSKLKDSADYDIGDDVPYTLTFKLPDDYASYDTYYVSFVDDMSAGLTYNGDAKIFFGEADTNGNELGTAFAVDSQAKSSYTTPSAGKVYKYTIANLKTDHGSLAGGSVIKITYTAKLNDSAVIGSAGNPNKYQVEYSRNPNKDGDGERGTTPWDTNIVFTYKTVFNKVDQSGDPLTGADFTLYKFIEDENGTDTYNSKKGTWTDVTTLGDGTNRPSKAIDSYTKGTKTAVNASFTFSGIDAGVYKLKESKTPTGYNTLEDQIFTITATHELEADNPKLTALTGTGGAQFNMTPVMSGTGSDATLTGELDADIENNKGATLPSTGGMGTTIFYIIGVVLLAGAAIILVTKRRMNAE